MKLNWLMVMLAVGGVAATAGAQATSAWTVKPEWVRAHEEFLASDVMKGRGSATRDEELAATYVASEFIGYGLRPPPGMTGYIQSAEIFSPVLDGHAGLSAVGLQMKEGEEFQVLLSSGSSVNGPLLKVKAEDAMNFSGAKGALILVTDVAPGDSPMAAAQNLRRSGALMVLVEEGEGSEMTLKMNRGRTPVPIRLKDRPEWGGTTIVALNGEGMARLAAMKTGEMVSLWVHAVPQAKPRATFNAMGYLEGTDASAGTILLTAHLDHVGVRRPEDGGETLPGANDDAAGTTAVLELAHALSAGPRLRRSILFVCYGSEELGMFGSTYFGEHSPVPLKDIVANLEFEMIGAQDPTMPKGVLALTGWERSNLGPELKKHGALLAPDAEPELDFFERSDNYSLALKGVVAHTAAGWLSVPTYHQPSDDLAHLDLAFMTAAIQSLVGPMEWLADSDFKPVWLAGKQPRSRN